VYTGRRKNAEQGCPSGWRGRGEQRGGHAGCGTASGGGHRGTSDAAAKKVREAEILLTVREVWKYEVEAIFCRPLNGNLMGREKGRRGRLWAQKREYRNKGN
jgi:hypothetical protein